MKRESFVFYESFYSAISVLPKNEQLLMLKAVVERALYGTEPNLSGVSKAMYSLIIPQLEANERRYKNGCKGGRPKPKNNQDETETKPNNNQDETETKPNVNDNDNVNDNVNVNDNKYTSPTATKPTKHKYGTHKNVLLTDEEYLKLQERFPTDCEEKINTLSEGIALKGYKYKSHYLAVIKWAETERARNQSSGAPNDYDRFVENLKEFVNEE